MIKTELKYVVNTPEETIDPKKLYELTYPEVLESVKPVISLKGELWAGKDRKNDLRETSYQNALWREWINNVSSAQIKGLINQEHPSMVYLRSVPSLVKPPVKEEPSKPTFIWSPSKLADFDTCPYQFAAKHYYKTLPYTETAATIWGTRVHKAAEDFFNGVENNDHEAFAPVEKWCKALASVPGQRFVEFKMGVDSAFKPVEWSDPALAGRMILDFGILREGGEELVLADWKTGNFKPDETQLKIYSLIMAIRFPTVKKITYKYLWTKTQTTHGATVERTQLKDTLIMLQTKLAEIRQAWDNENFRQKRNGLCRSFCGVKDCPHMGGR